MRNASIRSGGRSDLGVWASLIHFSCTWIMKLMHLYLMTCLCFFLDCPLSQRPVAAVLRYKSSFSDTVMSQCCTEECMKPIERTCKAATRWLSSGVRNYMAGGSMQALSA